MGQDFHECGLDWFMLPPPFTKRATNMSKKKSTHSARAKIVAKPKTDPPTTRPSNHSRVDELDAPVSSAPVSIGNCAFTRLEGPDKAFALLTPGGALWVRADQDNKMTVDFGLKRFNVLDDFDCFVAFLEAAAPSLFSHLIEIVLSAAGRFSSVLKWLVTLTR